MKIAVTAHGKDLDARVDERFGRADGFVVYDDETGDFVFLDNEENQQAGQGAGTNAAQLVANAGAKVLLTGHVGPRAFEVLKAAGIRVFETQAETVREAIEAWRAGKLSEVESPNPMPGHGDHHHDG